MDNWFSEAFGARINDTLMLQGITEPTAVQRAVIPMMLGGRDCIAQAPTGTGKTLAYLLPILAKVDLGLRAVQAIVLSPTRELAAQIARVCDGLDGAAGEPGSLLLIGGASLTRQVERLKEKPRVVVGSALRVLELIEMKKLSVHNARVIVLDEADRLLDKDNIEATTRLVKKTLADRQLCAFSASVTKQAEGAALALMKEPYIYRESENLAVPGNLGHIIIQTAQREKLAALRRYLNKAGDYRAIVFVNNPYHVRSAAERLARHGIAAAAIYGGMGKEERRVALERFRSGAVRALVASDLAARGLDVARVTHVVNLDAPDKPEDYLHRAGRAGRGGEAATVATIATAGEAAKVLALGRSLNINLRLSEG